MHVSCIYILYFKNLAEVEESVTEAIHESDLLKEEHGGWWLPGDRRVGLPGRAWVRLALVARFSMAILVIGGPLRGDPGGTRTTQND